MAERPRVALLIETSNSYARGLLPLAVIADRTGFKHAEYMSVAFKRQTGLSPQFRKKGTQLNSG
ncbi:MAG TPA: hypothetical protein VGG30_06215 [Pirellulales bacterium]